MKICIYGAGAIGGLLGARLARSGQEVSMVARGETLARLQERGLTLVESRGGKEVVTRVDVRAVADPDELGPQDVVVVAVKATGLADIAPRLASLVGEHTTVLSAMNGIPWWFFHGMPGPYADLQLATLDPVGDIAAAVPADRVLGSVVHLSASSPERGVVRHGAGDRLILGEPTGGAPTARLTAVAAALTDAGFEVELSDRIQRDIWFKLWGNMTMNPLSALTGATVDRILDDELVRAFATRCMLEANEVGVRIGLPIDQDPEERHAVTRKIGAARTSMLQDVDAGRPVELDVLVTAVRELAGHVGVTTPNIDTLLGLARLHARTQGLYPAPAPAPVPVA